MQRYKKNNQVILSDILYKIPYEKHIKNQLLKKKQKNYQKFLYFIIFEKKRL
jgi:hypothetical protein